MGLLPPTCRGFRNPADGRQATDYRGIRNRSTSRGGWRRARGFRNHPPSGYWEPQGSGDREPRLTVYSEPPFVVTGTHARGFRNQRLRKAAKFQRLADLSTTLNALTSFYNRISSNAAAAKTTPTTPPLGGFAPAGSLRRFAATPRALTRPPTRHPPIGVGLTPDESFFSRWFL